MSTFDTPFRRAFFLCLPLLISTQDFGQTIRITGLVTDSVSSHPVAGAMVTVLQKSSLTASTIRDGSFVLAGDLGTGSAVAGARTSDGHIMLSENSINNMGPCQNIHLTMPRKARLNVPCTRHSDVYHGRTARAV